MWSLLRITVEWRGGAAISRAGGEPSGLRALGPKQPVRSHLHIYCRHASLTRTNRPVAHDKCKLFLLLFVLVLLRGTYGRVSVLRHIEHAYTALESLFRDPKQSVKAL